MVQNGIEKDIEDAFDHQIGNFSPYFIPSTRYIHCASMKAVIHKVIASGGIRGLGELKKRVDSGEMRVALALYPVSMKQLMDIADSGNIMPPKTTWFEPKLRSGLIIHKLS